MNRFLILVKMVLLVHVMIGAALQAASLPTAINCQASMAAEPIQSSGYGAASQRIFWDLNSAKAQAQLHCNEQPLVLIKRQKSLNTASANPLSSITFDDPKLTQCVADNYALSTTIDEVKFLNCRSKNITSLAGVEHLTALVALYLDDNTISDLSPLSTLTALQVLWLRNNQISDLSALGGLTSLQSLYLYHNKIGDISALSALTGLQTLWLSENQITDISALAALTGLKELVLYDNAISNISGVAGLKQLEMLWLSQNKVSDISSLQGLTALKTAYLTDNDIITVSLSGPASLQTLDLVDNQLSTVNLSALTALQALYLDNNQISTLGLSGLSALTTLWADNNQLSDLGGLTGLTALDLLSLNGNRLIELSGLAGLTTLTSVFLDNNSLNDLSGLAGLTALQTLWMQGNQLKDVSALAELSELSTVQLYDNQLSDISPLTGLSKLQTLGLNNNQLSDISPLAELTALQWLAVGDNQISDMRPLVVLEKLESLFIHDNQISDLSVLAKLENLLRLNLGGNPLSDISPLLLLDNQWTYVDLRQINSLPCWQLDSFEIYAAHKSWRRPTTCDDSQNELDFDNDGLSNAAELADGTHPARFDSDRDGIGDKDELDEGFDPNDGEDVWVDIDKDRLPLILERREVKDENVKDNDVFGDNRLLVHQAYVDITRGFATKDELVLWTEKLNSGASLPADVYSPLLDETILSHYGFIGRVYLAIMGRAPDFKGVQAHLAGLQRGVTEQTVVDTFVKSVEFVERYGDLSNGDFVDLVYKNVLGREPDPDGFSNWIGLLNSGEIGRDKMMLGFINSKEYKDTWDKKQRVDVLNLLLTQQPLDKGKTAAYEQMLEAQESINGVVRAILASDGYRQSLMASISAANDDTDSDGISDGVEFVDGTDETVKDNDITDNDRLFVKQMLRDMNGEQWSEQAVTAQLAALGEKGSRTAWVESLLVKPEFEEQRQAISRLYFAFFLRGADFDGLMGWLNHYEAGMTLEVMAGHFAGSKEFIDRYGSLSNDGFIHRVYENVLGREADPGGFVGWKDHLDSGRLTWGDMMVAFSESKENIPKDLHRGRVVLLFNLLYRRAASDSEFTSWRDRLSNDPTAVADLINEIIDSNEYLARFY